MFIRLRVVVDINRLKEKLIKKAKKKGLYENFGQREVGQLRERYSDYEYSDRESWSHITDFNKWCKNLRGS